MRTMHWKGAFLSQWSILFELNAKAIVIKNKIPKTVHYKPQDFMRVNYQSDT